MLSRSRPGVSCGSPREQDERRRGSTPSPSASLGFGAPSVTDPRQAHSHIAFDLGDAKRGISEGRRRCRRGEFMILSGPFCGRRLIDNVLVRFALQAHDLGYCLRSKVIAWYIVDRYMIPPAERHCERSCPDRTLDKSNSDFAGLCSTSRSESRTCSPTRSCSAWCTIGLDLAISANRAWPRCRARFSSEAPARDTRNRQLTFFVDIDHVLIWPY